MKINQVLNCIKVITIISLLNSCLSCTLVAQSSYARKKLNSIDYVLCHGESEFNTDWECSLNELVQYTRIKGTLISIEDDVKQIKNNWREQYWWNKFNKEIENKLYELEEEVQDNTALRSAIITALVYEEPVYEIYEGIRKRINEQYRTKEKETIAELYHCFLILKFIDKNIINYSKINKWEKKTLIKQHKNLYELLQKKIKKFPELIQAKFWPMP